MTQLFVSSTTRLLLITVHSKMLCQNKELLLALVVSSIELDSTFGNGFCHLFRSHFGRCRVCYPTHCLVLVISQSCRQNVSIRVVRCVAQCRSTLTKKFYCPLNVVHLENEMAESHSRRMLSRKNKTRKKHAQIKIRARLH